MNVYLNYILEANIGLLLFLGGYKLLLSRETNFGLTRLVLLAGVSASLLFPLIHIDNADSSVVSIGAVIPAYWLPGVMVSEPVMEVHDATSNFWRYTSLVYSAGWVICTLIMLIQVTQVLGIIRRSKTYRLEKLRIAESEENKPTFSFFRFIFIGKANLLTPSEKQQIIRHESVHAMQWHSFDILMISVLKVFFWFNPFINSYKKIFIQLHEFEADARAVENSDVNKYCSLLAKVALQSADVTIANHFNNSLTVKRIEMMRSIKNKIQPWRMVMVALVIPLSFFLIACHDQIGQNNNSGPEQIFLEVDEMATPEGGMETFYNNIKKSIRYPLESRSNHKYGKVLAEFVVNEDGSLSDIRLLDSPDELLGNEAIRILNENPKWISAKKYGAAVKQRLVLPIVFRLDFPGMENVEDQREYVPSKQRTSLNEVVVVGWTSK